MAAAIGVDGDGGVSVVLRERAEEGEEHRGSEKGRGGCVASRTGSRATRGRRQAGGGRGIASARHRAASGRGEEDDRRRWAGPRWASPVGPPGGLRGERQVSALFYFLFVLFFLICFATVLNLK